MFNTNSRNVSLFKIETDEDIEAEIERQLAALGPVIEGEEDGPDFPDIPYFSACE